MTRSNWQDEGNLDPAERKFFQTGITRQTHGHDWLSDGVLTPTNPSFPVVAPSLTYDMYIRNYWISQIDGNNNKNAEKLLYGILGRAELFSYQSLYTMFNGLPAVELSDTINTNGVAEFYIYIPYYSYLARTWTPSTNCVISNWRDRFAFTGIDLQCTGFLSQDKTGFRDNVEYYMA